MFDNIYFGTETVSFTGPKICDTLNNGCKYATLIQNFKENLKRWIPENCPCRLRKTYIQYVPSKHSSWWRRTEDAFKTSWRRLQGIIARRLFEDVLKTSWRRRLGNTSSKRLGRRLEDVLKTSWRRIGNTSWRSLEDVLWNKKLLRWTRLEDVLKTSWKTGNVCWACSFNNKFPSLSSSKTQLNLQLKL